MSEQDEMTVPVTRGELRQELGELEQKLDRKLELWGGALLDRMDKQFAAFDKRMEERQKLRDERFAAFQERMQQFEKTMRADFARWAKAIHESLMKAVGVVDDQYKDLPPRVSKLERKVFPPRTRRR